MKNGKFLIACLFVIFLGIEVLIRVFLASLSADEKHISEISGIVSDLAREDSPRVLFVGNSMTRAGVDLRILRNELASQGVSGASLATIHPDDTVPVHWKYIVKNHVIDLKSTPDLIVMGGAVWHLQDSAGLRLRELGSDWCGFGDLLELVVQESLSFDEGIELIGSWASSAFAKQERIKNRFLTVIIPGFQKAYRSFHEMSEGRQEPDPASPGFDRVRRYGGYFRSAGLNVVFVGMPTQGGWQIGPEFHEAIRSRDFRFIDLRNVEGLLPHHFKDEMHLNSEGAVMYSRSLAQEIGRMLESGTAGHEDVSER